MHSGVGDAVTAGEVNRGKLGARAGEGLHGGVGDAAAEAQGDVDRAVAILIDDCGDEDRVATEEGVAAGVPAVGSMAVPAVRNSETTSGEASRRFSYLPVLTCDRCMKQFRSHRLLYQALNHAPAILC